MSPAHRRYDKAYFDKWYRSRAHRVSTRASAQRKAALALSVAEYYLERPARSVLDIGCGEGQWQPILAKLRPGIRYLGIDPSEYVVKKYGGKRNIILGSFSDLPDLDLSASYDLIVCSDILYYVSEEHLHCGLKTLLPKLTGIAFFEAYASDTPLNGDTRTMEKRDARFYRRLFRRHGLVACGSHCYAGPELAYRVTDLETGGISP